MRTFNRTNSRIALLSCLSTLGLCFAAGCENATQQPTDVAKTQQKARSQSPDFGTGLHQEILSLSPDIGTGLHLKSRTNADDSVTQYTIFIPEGYSPDRASPLILALHPGGPQNLDHYGKGVLEGLVLAAFYDLNAIVVAPDSTGGRWNSEANDASVTELLDEVYTVLNVDKKRTLVVGYSMGGHGTWFFADKYPEKFAAAIPIAGRPPKNVDLKIPLRAINSDNDAVVKLETVKPPLDKMVEDGKDVELIVLNGPTHYERLPYVKALKELAPWIETVWEQEAK